jgi:Tol biopolymer transport system component
VVPQPVVGPGEEWIAAQIDGYIHLIRPDGTGNHAPFRSVPSGEQLHADWSPDGERLSFTIRAATDAIWIGGVDGSNARLVADCQAPCQSADEAAWSPDGSSLVFQRSTWKDGEDVSTLEILNVTTNEVRVVLTAPKGRAFYQPRWSPDGSKVVTEYSRTATDGSFQVALAVVDLTAAKPAADEITDATTLTNSPDWSWATNLIVFARPSTPAAFDGPSDIVTIRPDGTGTTVLVNVGARGGQTPQPAWSPDGSRIIFVQPDTSMATVAADGSDFQPAIHNGPDQGLHPRYRPVK